MNILIMNSARKYIGEAAHCLALAAELRKRGHEATLAVREGFELERRARNSGIPVLPLRMNGSFSPSGDWRDLLAVRRFALKNQAELIHCHRGKDHWLAAALVTLGGVKLPVVRTRHVVVAVRNHWPNRWLFQNCTKQIIAVSRKAAESFGTLLPSLEDSLTVIYSAIDLDLYNPGKRSLPWREELRVPPDAPLIGLIARIQNIKGQRVFLRAAAEVLKEVPNAIFLVAGSGIPVKFARLERFADGLGIGGHVRFLGWIRGIDAAIASLDVGVIASLGSEGSSRIAYEFMASGVPVVATTVGGIPEILEDGRNGILVPPGDSAALARGIIRVATSKQLAGTLRNNALEQVRERHNYDVWTDRILAVYRQACAEGGSSPR